MPNSHDISWKRTAVEAAAIVASILLAFAIDAWWNERLERAEEREVMQSLYVEFEANRDEAAAVISFHNRVTQPVVMLMELRQDETLALPAEAVEEFISSLGNPRTFDAVRGSVDALISSGKLGLLRDHELRAALTTFVNIVDDAVEDANYLAQSSTTIWNEIVKNGGPWRTKQDALTAEDCAGPHPHRSCYINDALTFLPVATPQDLLRLRNNTLLMGYVYQEKVNAMHYSAEIRRAEIQIETVLRLLEDNI